MENSGGLVRNIQHPRIGPRPDRSDSLPAEMENQGVQEQRLCISPPPQYSAGCKSSQGPFKDSRSTPETAHLRPASLPLSCAAGHLLGAGSLPSSPSSLRCSILLVLQGCQDAKKDEGSGLVPFCSPPRRRSSVCWPRKLLTSPWLLPICTHTEPPMPLSGGWSSQEKALQNVALFGFWEDWTPHATLSW